jgi:hypothetical protein
MLPTLVLVLFKVDFEKAFDSVRWDFLLATMEKMRFSKKWRGWIRECLVSSRIFVLVNGSPTEEFSPSRGLRQGDPLSPFLFLIVAEGFNALIKQAKEEHLFTGIPIGSERIVVSHLQFADDTLLFCQNSDSNIWAIKSMLRLFELASGLKVNFHKSQVLLLNVDIARQEEVAHFLGCRLGVLPFLYLGLPIGANHKCLSTWYPRGEGP